jgi:predicted GIY-YIG superfamily endonuclease
MRDATDAILYIGKAKNLRKRLASYRVANPDRMRRRQLRLLRAVERIEFQECADEASALARESALLRSVRPRFNRAGTWPAPPRFIGWRLDEGGIELVITDASQPGWSFQGPLGPVVLSLRASLVRLIWCAIHSQQGLQGLPHGWFAGPHPDRAVIPFRDADPTLFETANVHLHALFAGEAAAFENWIRERTACRAHAFEINALENDLETILEFSKRRLAANS